MSLKVEICACSVDDVVQAQNGGADRIELCSALPLGGLTPSAGTTSQAKEISPLPIFVMIRPRAGGFAYSELEFAAMERDIEIALSLGADGFVFGILNEDGTVDTKRMANLVARANGRPTVFHRAIDVTPDPFDALQAILGIGMSRVLTSGQQPTALEGAETIRQLVEQAEDRIEIMAGGEVRPANVLEVVKQTGCRSVHLAPLRKLTDPSTLANPRLTFSSTAPRSEDQVDIIDHVTVAEVVAKVRAYGV